MTRITISNATQDAIRRALNGERVNAVEQPPNLIRCEYCGKEFNRLRKTQRFCSTKCRVYHHRNIE